MMKKWYSKLLFYLLLLLLFVPLIQQQFHFSREKPLKGYFEKMEADTLTLKGWFSGEYQNNQQAYTEENIGFKASFVRINNQIDFSLYQDLNAENVIRGKNGFFHGGDYIRAYTGEDFLGESHIINKVEKLKMISDTLSKKGIDIIVVFAPGKAHFMPETIPEEYLKNKGDSTNYEYYAKEIHKKGLNFLDLQKLFTDMKDTIKHPLYPKGGYHWSKYGEILAADTMFKFIAKVTDINMPLIDIKDFYVPGKPQSSDDEIEEALNLFFELPHLPLAYPNFTYKTDSSTIKPNVLFVSDSYYWGLFNYGMSSMILNDSEFWYYNNEVHPHRADGTTMVSDLDLIPEIEKNDAIVIMSTDANLRIFAYHFIDRVYDAYFVKE